MVLIEFALALPLLLLLLVGTIEISRYLLFQEKLKSAATQMLDIITQGTSNVSADGLNEVFSVLPQMLLPYSANNAQVVVTQIVRPPDVNGKECKAVALWQYGPATSRIAAGEGDVADVKDIWVTAGDNLMSLEVTAEYIPLLDTSLTRELLGGVTGLYTASYGHTRYGAFTMKPSGSVATAQCIPD